MKTKKLTPVGKFVVLLLVVAVVAAVVYFTTGFNFNFAKDENQVITNNKQLVSNTNTPVSNSNSNSNSESATNEINLSISERIGWKPILDANGGLTTQPGSIYDKLGLKVNIKVDNNTTTSSKEFIDGEVNALGYTVNRYAGVYKSFNDLNIETVMPYIVSSSIGGDGIVVRGNIKTVEDFANHKIGVPNLAAGQTLVWWLMLKSDLTDEQLEKIKNNIVIYDNTIADSEAFFNGEVDIAVTKQPYLNQAKNGKDTSVLFTTKSASNLIQDGVLFRKDFVENNRDTVVKFIDGAIQALDHESFKNIKQIPIFKEKNDSELKEMLTETKLADYSLNVKLLGGMSQDLFEDMSNIWEKAGESVMYGQANNALTSDLLKDLSGKYKITNNDTVVIDESQKQKAMNEEALIKKSVSIVFKPNSANFANEKDAEQVLNEFVSIAQFIEGAVIQVEGNISNTGVDDPKAAEKLSYARAKTVADFLQQKGVDPSRFIVIGNGGTKQIAPNDTEENKMKNRRTDIFFKVIE